MLQNCINLRSEISRIIKELEILSVQYTIKQNGIGEEHLAKYDISEALKDYLFVLKGILYRWDNCFELLLQAKDEIKKISNSFNEDMIMCGSSTCDKLSYEFENLIVSFSKLNEEPTIINLTRVMSKENQKNLKDNCFNKEDIDGLYWQLNLLRNRFAHSTPGYYSTNTTEVQRYMAISSRIFNIEVKDKKLFLKTTLINLNKNDYVKKVIQEVIIDKKFGEEESQRPLMDLLFSTKPRGKNKSKPTMIFINNLGNFDLNEDFLILSLQMFDYIETQLKIIKNEFEIQLEPALK